MPDRGSRVQGCFVAGEGDLRVRNGKHIRIPCSLTAANGQWVAHCILCLLSAGARRQRSQSVTVAVLFADGLSNGVVPMVPYCEHI